LAKKSCASRVGQEGITGHVAATGFPTWQTTRSEITLHRRRPPPHTRSELAVPIRAGDRVLGVLDVNSEREAFDEHDLFVTQSWLIQLASGWKSPPLRRRGPPPARGRDAPDGQPRR